MHGVPSVSLVVPVHGLTPAFRRCLESIRALDPAPDELVVVVDGGDEGAAAEAAAAGAHVVLQKPQSGPAVARNTGAVRASGDILLFLDSDVEAAPDVVARVVGAFAEEPDVTALIGSYDDRPPAHNLASLYMNLRHHYVHQNAREEGRTFWGACGAIRRNAFEKIGGFDEDYVAASIEDIELGYRLKEAGMRIRVIKDLHAKHLKRWDVRSLLTTDIVYRALPWSALIVRSRRLDDDLNISVGERAKSVMTLAAVVALLASVRWPLAAVGALVLLGSVLAADSPFLRLLASRGGARLALWGAGWHLAYHLYTILAFFASALRHLVFGPQPAHTPWPGSPRRWVSTGPAPKLVRVASEARQPLVDAPPRPTLDRVIVRRRRAHASHTVTTEDLLRQSRRMRRWVPAALLLALGALLLPAYSDTVGPDALAQIRIAQYYAEGDLARALNGYWGPLSSWLLTPLLAVGIEPLLAAKLLGLGLGVLVLVALGRLCIRCGVRPATADGAVLVTVPLVLHVVLNDAYSHVLLIVLLLLFVADVLPSETESARKGAARAGLWGGLASLAHPYALPVVVAVTVASHLVAARRAQRAGEVSAGRAHARLTLGTLAAVAALVLTWSAVLSAHYQTLTFNQSWGYNAAVVAPGSAGQPLSNGLVEPPYPGALFAWENPSTMPLVTGGWRPSGESASHLLENLAANARELAALVAGEFLVVPLFAFAGALLLLLRRRRAPPAPRSAWPALSFAVAIYLAGSLVTFVEPQFLWFVVLALVPLAATCLDLPVLRPSLHRRDRDYSLWRLAGFALLAVGVTIEAVLNLQQAPEGARVSALAAQVEVQAPKVAADLEGARVASTRDWEASSLACFRLGCTYLGEVGTGKRATAESARRADYLFVWRNDPANFGEVGRPAADVGELRIHAPGPPPRKESSEGRRGRG